MQGLWYILGKWVDLNLNIVGCFTGLQQQGTPISIIELITQKSMEWHNITRFITCYINSIFISWLFTWENWIWEVWGERNGPCNNSRGTVTGVTVTAVTV